jgi:hypothetical protein
MYKTVHLMKRRVGMSHAEFVEYYQTHHYKYVATIQEGGVTKYVRKFLTEGLYPEREPEWDCIMELWWTSKEARDKTIEGRDAELVRITSEDELKLFDLESMLIYSYEEFETELPVAEAPPAVAAYWAGGGPS